MYKYISSIARESILLQRTASILLVVVAVLVIGIMVVEWLSPSPYRDMIVYYNAGCAVLSGDSPYRPYINYGPDVTPSRYLYSPPFAAVISPATMLGYVNFARIWYLLLFLLYCFYARSLARQSFGRAGWLQSIVYFSALACLLCGQRALIEGQADIIIWALLALAISDKRPASALSAASLIKPHLIWPLMLVIRHNPKKAIPEAVLTLGLFGLVGGTACGFGAFSAWLTSIAPLAQGSFSFNTGHITLSNVSLSMAGLRLLHGIGIWHYTSGPLPLGPRVYLSTFAIMAPVLAGWLSRKWSYKKQLAVVAVSATLASPICWAYYLPICAALIAVCINESRPCKKSRNEQSVRLTLS